MSDRDYPKPYIETALTLFRNRGLKSIVEIGSMRSPLRHPLYQIGGECCMDGHSTLFWADATDDFTTVDIRPKAARMAARSIRRMFGRSSARVLCMDGIEFLKTTEQKIDLLYLDGWDAGRPDSTQKHLEAYLAAQRSLHSSSLVLIDDTDIELDPDGVVLGLTQKGLQGKGKLVIPRMLEAGWSVAFSGRQTLLAKDVSSAAKASLETELAERMSHIGEIPAPRRSFLDRLFRR